MSSYRLLSWMICQLVSYEDSWYIFWSLYASSSRLYSEFIIYLSWLVPFVLVGCYCMLSAGNCWLDSGAVGLELACCRCPPSEAVDSTVELFWNWKVQRGVVVCLVRLSAQHKIVLEPITDCWCHLTSDMSLGYQMSIVITKLDGLSHLFLEIVSKIIPPFLLLCDWFTWVYQTRALTFVSRIKMAGLACETKFFITFKLAKSKDIEGNTMQ